MKRAGLVRLGALLAALLLVSACGAGMNGSIQRDKIAVISWEKVQKAHPEYAKLEQGEKVLKDLLNRRKNQEKMAQAQMSSLHKLQALRKVSQQSYLEADFNTRMVEQREIENAKLMRFTAEAEKEAEAQLASRRKEIEDSYRLQIFNIRANLESVMMRPQKKAELEQQLKQLQLERGEKIGALEEEKRSIVEAKLHPYVEEMQQRMAQTAAQHKNSMQETLTGRDDKEKELLADAPKALSKALEIMDREIDKQQEKNDTLRGQIKNDIESRVVQLAKERSYTIVFNQYKANVKAEDITDDVIGKLKSK